MRRDAGADHDREVQRRVSGDDRLQHAEPAELQGGRVDHPQLQQPRQGHRGGLRHAAHQRRVHGPGAGGQTVGLRNDGHGYGWQRRCGGGRGGEF